MTKPTLPPRRPVLLLILDGFGVNPGTKNNAIAQANTPKMDELFATHPMTVLEACGRAVGLPDGQMGNSEVGHLTLGCGSILRQDLVRINDAAADGSMKHNPNLRAAAERAAKANRPLHLWGLVSDGGIHSHIDHLLCLIEMCAEVGARPLVHMVTDGRDTAPQCATDFLPALEKALDTANGGIATVVGRYFSMDRDQRWDRVEKGWRAMVQGVGESVDSAAAGIETAWAKGQTDEFIEPLITPAFEAISGDDEVVFINFRNDRPREMSLALAGESFEHFDRGEGYRAPSLTTMTQYDKSYNFPIAFEKEKPSVTLGEVISQQGIAQFHSAETEKYPHVTFFFNGGKEEPYPGESRKLINSPKVATYDLQPEMSANEVADATCEALASGEYGFVVVNFANGDMVGHTGVVDAAVKAVETLDEVVDKVMSVAKAQGFSVLLTADHGNCDMMVDPVSGKPHTQHTNFPVPCLLADEQYTKLVTGEGLSAIAPTVLQLMGLEQPADMGGKSLLLS